MSDAEVIEPAGGPRSQKRILLWVILGAVFVLILAIAGVAATLLFLGSADQAPAVQSRPPAPPPTGGSTPAPTGAAEGSGDGVIILEE